MPRYLASGGLASATEVPKRDEQQARSRRHLPIAFSITSHSPAWNLPLPPFYSPLGAHCRGPAALNLLQRTAVGFTGNIHNQAGPEAPTQQHHIDQWTDEQGPGGVAARK